MIEIKNISLTPDCDDPILMEIIARNFLSAKKDYSELNKYLINHYQIFKYFVFDVITDIPRTNLRNLDLENVFYSYKSEYGVSRYYVFFEKLIGLDLPEAKTFLSEIVKVLPAVRHLVG